MVFLNVSLRQLTITILLSSIFCPTSVVEATSHNHRHLHLSRQDAGSSGLGNTNTTFSNISTSAATALVKAALAEIAVKNKLRLDNPRFNQYLPGNSKIENNSEPVPISVSNATIAQRSNDTASSINYSISAEIANAARVVAESITHTSAALQDIAAAKELKAKYWPTTNDTNSVSRNISVLAKRDAAFWMSDMPMDGLSPHAPSGYVVFRNVKDYGAVGDGVTDDTAAINLAVSSGGRCGVTCGSSTIYPAVVYFPGGTYLVSTSIIQYYNTQFIGDPLNRPIILGASSFVGQGVISSDVYIVGGNSAEWYIYTNNFLRSIRNMIIDITNTDPNASICGLHWQVAQGTDLQNVDFYMKSGTTQQGIWMENGSGGFLSQLYFKGGKFGAYFGNQQFTSRNLLFVGCETGMQIHWDWGWTLQGLVFLEGTTGIIITGGAGGTGSNGQSVGSMLITDSIFEIMSVGISTSLLADNSTSFLLQNAYFSICPIAVRDVVAGNTMLVGSAAGQAKVASWGFGYVVDSNTSGSFVKGNTIASANRTSDITISSGDFFTRGAPTYDSLSAGAMINVKSQGAKGDGTSDDTVVLNQILSVAANSSAVVFFPFGIYIITDTLKVPVGSRIVGQAWSQIMASGPKFANIRSPHVAVQVGSTGDSGIIEISDMMVTVSGPTAGAVLMEWNVHQSTQGSAALWNTHLRVGGAAGTGLQASQCPKLSGSVNSNCIAAALQLHVTPAASGYFENLWAWTADHDLDLSSQVQIDIYSARGILIESRGPTWFWGSASEHNVLYQYQLSSANNTFMGMIQTESPYFQNTPDAPLPFSSGLYPNDPTFLDCATNSKTCAISWALRIIDSTTSYVYGAGLYSWYSEYNQDCVATNNCQDKGVEIVNSTGIWIYNLATKAIVQMVSPANEIPTYASNDVNGYLSSIIAWLKGSIEVSGASNFTGFTLVDAGSLSSYNLTSACEAAMYQIIDCDDIVDILGTNDYHGTIGNTTVTNSVCAASCNRSLTLAHKSIALACSTTPNLIPGVPLIAFIDSIWSGWNETCLVDPATGNYCNAIMDAWPEIADTAELPAAELCSYCYMTKFSMMEKSPYSGYDNDTVETRYRYAATTCGSLVTDFNPAPRIITPNVTVTKSTCVSNNTYVVESGDSCDSIAAAKNVSSSSLYAFNPSLINCKSPTVPKGNDTCVSIATANGMNVIDFMKYNPMINSNCSNLFNADPSWGSTLCVSIPGGPFSGASNANSTIIQAWVTGTGYSDTTVVLPSTAKVATGTTLNCGGWFQFNGTETCSQMCLENIISYALFLSVNPSLGRSTCDTDLIPNLYYCVQPTYDWNSTSVVTASQVFTSTAMPP